MALHFSSYSHNGAVLQTKVHSYADPHLDATVLHNMQFKAKKPMTITTEWQTGPHASGQIWQDRIQIKTCNNPPKILEQTTT
ncbi:hypothetical protein NPIL_387811 [Nephila pilipes]|uniref:Uncharacterized protein n=1 Tax=Nephila pilipes TaxID=299642 RepID=A0A8X6UF96_NEPPI|nr:hypothetical protein NPIL_387811 [Nephila pilipes]